MTRAAVQASGLTRMADLRVTRGARPRVTRFCCGKNGESGASAAMDGGARSCRRLSGVFFPCIEQRSSRLHLRLRNGEADAASELQVWVYTAETVAEQPDGNVGGLELGLRELGVELVRVTLDHHHSL